MFLEVFLFCGSAVLYYIYNEWSKRKRAGIPYLPYKFPFGHLDRVVKREKSFGMAVNEFYNQTSERLIGFYMIFKPAIMVRDPEIVKLMMTTHFEHFSDRGMYPNKKKHPLSATLFAMELDAWRPLRAKLTPAFSAAKLKQMMVHVENITKDLQNKLVELFDQGNKVVDVNIKDVTSRFIVDVIGSTIFGVEMNVGGEKDHPFQELTKNVTTARNSKFLEAVRLTFILLWPKVTRFFGIGDIAPFVSDFFINLVRGTIESREKSNEVRRDVMQLLLQLRNNGSVDNDSWEAGVKENGTPYLSIEECAANAFLFYIAGSESSSSTITFCLFELSREPEHLKTLVEEIDAALKAHNGTISYEALAEMKFMEKCINETIRKYPALPMLNRRCTKEFQVPGTNQIIYKDQTIIIPMLSIQTDPRYFPNPTKFNPNRCDPEDPDYSTVPYHAFGEGPKSCIAYRLGMLMVKAGLVAFLSKCHLECPTLNEEPEFSIGSLGMVPKDNFRIRFSLRNMP